MRISLPSRVFLSGEDCLGRTGSNSHTTKYTRSSISSRISALQHATQDLSKAKGRATLHAVRLAACMCQQTPHQIVCRNVSVLCAGLLAVSCLQSLLLSLAAFAGLLEPQCRTHSRVLFVCTCISLLPVTEMRSYTGTVSYLGARSRFPIRAMSDVWRLF